MILDATAGTRIMWRIENHNPYFHLKPDVFLDIRAEVKPDIVADWCYLPFREGTFDTIIFDPPHVHVGPKSAMFRRYGRISLRDFRRKMIRLPEEFHRVMKEKSLLIVKICDRNGRLDILTRNFGRKFKRIRMTESKNPGKAKPTKSKKYFPTYWIEYERC